MIQLLKLFLLKQCNYLALVFSPVTRVDLGFLLFNPRPKVLRTVDGIVIFFNLELDFTGVIASLFVSYFLAVV